MITKQKKAVPLYPCSIKIIIYDDSKELKGKYSAADGTERGFFQTDEFYLDYVIGIKSSCGVIAITHECEHVKNRIFHAIGYDTQQLNDETDCYLMGWLAGAVTDVFYKHKDLIKKNNKLKK